jgi:signal transduction histidine kinase
VLLRDDDGCVDVEIRDDGRGGARASAGSGLRGLEDRLSAVDDVVTIDSPPGVGTRVRARVRVGRDGASPMPDDRRFERRPASKPS